MRLDRLPRKAGTGISEINKCIGLSQQKKQIGRVKVMNFQGIKEIACGNSRGVPN